jgi:hypothetical protein
MYTLQRHSSATLKQIFPEMKLRSLVPNFHIHVSVSDLYIPDPSYFAGENRRTERGNI